MPHPNQHSKGPHHVRQRLVRLTAEQDRQLVELASYWGLSVSEALRRCVELGTKVTMSDAVTKLEK